MGSADSISNAFSNGISVNIPLHTGGLVEGQIDVAKLGKTNALEEILRSTGDEIFTRLKDIIAFLLSRIARRSS